MIRRKDSSWKRRVPKRIDLDSMAVMSPMDLGRAGFREVKRECLLVVVCMALLTVAPIILVLWASETLFTVSTPARIGMLMAVAFIGFSLFILFMKSGMFDRTCNIGNPFKPIVSIIATGASKRRLLMSNVFGDFMDRVPGEGMDDLKAATDIVSKHYCDEMNYGRYLLILEPIIRAYRDYGRVNGFDLMDDAFHLTKRMQDLVIEYSGKVKSMGSMELAMETDLAYERLEMLRVLRNSTGSDRRRLNDLSERMVDNPSSASGSTGRAGE